MCVCLHMYVLHKAATASREGGDTSKLNGIGALWGLRDNTGLTDPTKWPIMSQWRNLGSKIDPKSYHCHSPWISRHTNTHTGEEEGYGWL